jgi:hypothetical protein
MGVSEIVEKLRSEEARLMQQVEKLQAQMSGAESELAQVQAALVALGQKAAGKSSSRAIKPAASRRDIVAAIGEALDEQGVIETAALRQYVEQKLAGKGRSRQNFAQRFAESLVDARFVETPAGWRLAAETEAERETPAPASADSAAEVPCEAHPG